MTKLSVLIPTYNCRCYTLAETLQKQLAATGEDYEILVADDGSRDQVSLIANLKINELDNCRFIRREKNVGRAAIRNFLADEAKGEWILFIDNDASVPSNGYIATYLETFKNNDIDAVVGGLYHPETCPSPHVTLRYRYEKKADLHRSAKERSEHPFMHFTTFNFAIRRKFFKQIRFDETCREYGYEDTLLGVELYKLNIRLIHIDNPLIHLGLDKNDFYLKKVETSLHTLLSLGDKIQDYSHVANTAKQLSNYHAARLYEAFFHVTKGIMRKNLTGAKPNLTVFSMYKLGLYIQLSHSGHIKK